MFDFKVNKPYQIFKTLTIQYFTELEEQKMVWEKQSKLVKKKKIENEDDVKILSSLVAQLSRVNFKQKVITRGFV